MRRRTRVLAAAFALAVGGLAAGAGAASAAPAPAAVPADQIPFVPKEKLAPPAQGQEEECKVAPDVESPLDGVTGQILSAPYSPPQGADPSMWENYGFAGLKWEGYDLGVTPPLLGGCWPNGESVNASMGSQIANMVFAGAKTIVALSDSLLHSAYNTEWLNVFDPYITEAVDSLRDKVFNDWVAVGTAILGIVLLFKAREMAFASSATLVGAAFLALTAATFVFTNPLWTAHTGDSALTGMSGDVAAAIGGAKVTNPQEQAQPDADHALIAAVHDALLFQPWVQGEFGSADSPTAKKYAKPLFDSQALTWDEAKIARQGGQAATDLINGKKAKFIAIVDKIKTEDPIAYSYIQGKRSTDRINFALMALLGALLSMPIIIMASMAMMCAFLILRMALIVVPVIAPIAVVRSSVGMNLVDRVVSISATALVWSFGLPVTMLLDRAALTAPNLNPWVRLVILALVAIGSFAFLIGMAPGFGGVLRRKDGRRAHRWFGRGLTYAAAWWGAHSARDDWEPEPATPRNRPVKGEVEDEANPYGDLPEDPLDVDWWDYEEPVAPVTAYGEPVEPDDVVRTSDAAERGLPTPTPRAAEAEDDDVPTVAAYEDDDGDVYDLWSGRSKTEWVEGQTSDTRDDADDDSPLAVGAGGSE